METMVMKSKRILLYFTFLAFLSCDEKFCKFENDLFNQTWRGEVAKTYRHSSMKATYVIESKSGDLFLIRPIQGVYTWAEQGDLIYKDSLSQFCYLIKHDTKDTLESRIFSSTCDPCMENWPCDREDVLENSAKKSKKSIDWQIFKIPALFLLIFLFLNKLLPWINKRKNK